jgi:hypothetical protein
MKSISAEKNGLLDGWMDGPDPQNSRSNNPKIQLSAGNKKSPRMAAFCESQI